MIKNRQSKYRRFLFAKCSGSLLFISTIMVVLNTNGQQVIKDQFDEHIPKIYPYIVFLSNGPEMYFVSTPFDDPNEKGEYGAYYRFIVTEFEVWRSLYLERISLGEESIDRILTDIVRIDVEKILPEDQRKEYIFIDSIVWEDSVTANIRINKKIYSIRADEFIPIGK